MQMKNGEDRFVSKKTGMGSEGMKLIRITQVYPLCVSVNLPLDLQQGSSQGDKFALEIQSVKLKKIKIIKTTTKQSCLSIISRLYLY